MRQLNKWQSAVFLIGGALMVVGAGLSMIQQVFAPYVYSVGALGFVAIQLLQRYEGTNMTLQRLRTIMVLSDVLFIVTAVLMFASRNNLFGLPQIAYVQYVYNKWVATLLLAAIIQLYVMHRMDHELKKEAKKR
jgi:hypothetical protein